LYGEVLAAGERCVFVALAALDERVITRSAFGCTEYATG
jgi:hypothetical protein